MTLGLLCPRPCSRILIQTYCHNFLAVLYHLGELHIYNALERSYLSKQHKYSADVFVFFCKKYATHRV